LSFLNNAGDCLAFNNAHDDPVALQGSIPNSTDSQLNSTGFLRDLGFPSPIENGHSIFPHQRHDDNRCLDPPSCHSRKQYQLIFAMKLQFFVLLGAILTKRVPVMQDFSNLYSTLRAYADDESSAIPHWLRSSFHDLANFDPVKKLGGPHGCMRDDPVRLMPQNSQLDLTIRELNLLIHETFPDIDFAFGDVISLAGKVAIEKIYPCLRIKWRPGRSQCGHEEEGAPGPDIQSHSQLKPFLDRYGFSARELALLLAGTHGLNLAVIHTDIKNELPMARVTSVKRYITDALTAKWHILEDEKPQTPMRCVFEGETDEGPVYRTPVDMMFYPTSVSKARGKRRFKVSDPKMISVETYLTNVANMTDFQVQKKFGKVFEKMLEIGMPLPQETTQYLPHTPFDEDIELVEYCMNDPEFELSCE
jgi:hypothetical protein